VIWINLWYSLIHTILVHTRLPVTAYLNQMSLISFEVCLRCLFQLESLWSSSSSFEGNPKKIQSLLKECWHSNYSFSVTITVTIITARWRFIIIILVFRPISINVLIVTMITTVSWCVLDNINQLSRKNVRSSLLGLHYTIFYSPSMSIIMRVFITWKKYRPLFKG